MGDTHRAGYHMNWKDTLRAEYRMEWVPAADSGILFRRDIRRDTYRLAEEVRRQEYPTNWIRTTNGRQPAGRCIARIGRQSDGGPIVRIGYRAITGRPDGFICVGAIRAYSLSFLARRFRVYFGVFFSFFFNMELAQAGGPTARWPPKLEYAKPPTDTCRTGRFGNKGIRYLQGNLTLFR